MLKSGELSEPFSFRIRWPRVEIPRVYGELWGERTRRLLERLERDSMSTHRVDDGTLQGAPFDPEKCPKCSRAGWVNNQKCWGCGWTIMAICTPPPVMTTPTDDPLTTAQDDVKTTLDGWSKGKQALAYKYLYSLGHRIVNASDDVRKEYGGRK